MRRADWLAHQLPVGMLDDEFLVRFLAIFQDVADTVLHEIDTLPHMFDASVAPEPMVQALGRGSASTGSTPRFPTICSGASSAKYSSLIRWRGTERGLEQLLWLITEQPAAVHDTGGVYAEGEAPPVVPHIRIEVAALGRATETDLLRIVKSEIPASVTFELAVAGTTIWPVTPGGGAATTQLQEVR